MKYILLLVFLGLIVLTKSKNVKTDYKNIAEYVNSLKTTWKAHWNINTDVTKFSFGNLYNKEKISKLPEKIHQIKENELPEEFDSAKQWPHCANIIENIRDQSHCGSCWAFGVTGAISDRICIHSKGKQAVFISAQDLLACCETCGDGCEGGYPDEAYSYYVKSGIVTGGLYQSNVGCIPYSLPNCSHHIHGSLPDCSTVQVQEPKCTRQCREGYAPPYKQDLHFGQKAYRLKGETHIMAEVFKNGPVTVGFAVYEDYMTYKSGVYQHVTGDFVGYHAVRLTGWGVENGVKYWKIANSWNNEWGINGTFLIKRGTDECDIETSLVCAGLPKL